MCFRPVLIALFFCFAACRHSSLPEQVGTKHARLFQVLSDSSLQLPDGSRFQPGIFNEKSRVICLSSVIAALFEELDLAHVVMGVDDVNYIASPGLCKRIEAGHLQSFATGGVLQTERIIIQKPDAVFYYTLNGSNEPAYRSMAEGGVQLIQVQNFLESDPLGRAEWLRFIGYLFNRRQTADSLFKRICDNYFALKSPLVRADAPGVFLNAPFAGQWNLPGGESYMARLISDAGAKYLWHDVPGTAAFSRSHEAVLTRAIHAEYWINCNDYMTRRELEEADARFTGFLAFRRGNVFAANKLKAASGANPFWEKGVVRPDMVLHDLRLIFSGDTATDDRLYFYRRLP
jgi:iron complex transport system substrate-binding protein